MGHSKYKYGYALYRVHPTSTDEEREMCMCFQGEDWEEKIIEYIEADKHMYTKKVIRWKNVYPRYEIEQLFFGNEGE